MSEDYPEIPEYIKQLMESGEKIDQIRLDREGNWFHEGEPFINQRIIDFFNRSIDVTAEGQYVIHYGDFVYPIEVEDTPLFVTGVRIEGFSFFEKIFITLSSGEEEELDETTLHYKQPEGLYCRVRNGRMPAKFKRSPSFQLLERLQETDDIYYLTIKGNKIVLEEK
ncbi:MAG: hypothetical protein ACOCWZ_03840 [Spirochaetota bacterium]